MVQDNLGTNECQAKSALKDSYRYVYTDWSFECVWRILLPRERKLHVYICNVQGDIDSLVEESFERSIIS